jgi:hypothetical protein
MNSEGPSRVQSHGLSELAALLGLRGHMSCHRENVGTGPLQRRLAQSGV